MTDLLAGIDLCLLRGDRCLFNNLSFALNRGELLLVEGPNGSGKTSLLRAVAGFLEFEAGEIHWDGAPIRQVAQFFRAETVWSAHRVGFKGDLTLIENLRFEAGLRVSSMQRLESVLERLGLSRLTVLPFRSLSAGQQRRVTLARMLLAECVLWLMDEPFTNLDVAGQALVTELLDEHLAAGGMAVVASHQPVDLEAPTQRVRLQ